MVRNVFNKKQLGILKLGKEKDMGFTYTAMGVSKIMLMNNKKIDMKDIGLRIKQMVKEG